eukprot:5506980-Pleurochrysis_carterae.AAC.1
MHSAATCSTACWHRGAKVAPRLSADCGIRSSSISGGGGRSRCRRSRGCCARSSSRQLGRTVAPSRRTIIRSPRYPARPEQPRASLVATCLPRHTNHGSPVKRRIGLGSGCCSECSIAMSIFTSCFRRSRTEGILWRTLRLLSSQTQSVQVESPQAEEKHEEARQKQIVLTSGEAPPWFSQCGSLHTCRAQKDI